MNKPTRREVIAEIKKIKNEKANHRTKISKSTSEYIKELESKYGSLVIKCNELSANNKKLIEENMAITKEGARAMELEKRLKTSEAKHHETFMYSNKLNDAIDALHAEKASMVAKHQREITELRTWYVSDGKTIDVLKDLIITLFNKREMKNETAKQPNPTSNTK